MSNPRLPLERLPNSPLPCQKSSQGRISDEEMSEILQNFAKRLYEAFNADKPSEIAQKLGTTDATVGYWVKGLRFPLADVLLQIHRITGVSLDWLLLGKGRKYVQYEQNFTKEEIAEIEAMAKRSGRTFAEELRRLAVIGKDAVKTYRD